MNRAFYVKALSMADRHVAQGDRIIAGQRLLIARLGAHRTDTTDASALLATFLISQQFHEDNQRRFACELTKFGEEQELLEKGNSK